jgi:hypothetical protein
MQSSNGSFPLQNQYSAGLTCIWTIVDIKEETNVQKGQPGNMGSL